MESVQERAIQTADTKVYTPLVNENKSSLQWAKRIDYRNLDYAVVEEVVMKKGHPLVVSNTTLSWKRDRQMFSWDWLKKHFGTTYIRPRNIQTFVDLPECPLSQYLNYMADPDFSQGVLYAKDVPCPVPWKEFISQKLTDFWCRGDNDLLGELPKELQPETLLIYLGMDGTCTPAHTDILGSLGNNVMVYSDSDAYALWACVGTEHRDKAAAFWKQNSANSDGTLYSDNVLLSMDTLSKAPFPVFLIEQREGDLVLLPPECAHQVINKNGRNVKVAWNTINYLSIENSYFSAVPLYRTIGKPQVYRVKAVAYSSLLTRLREASDTKSFRENLVEEFPPLLTIVEDMVYCESIGSQDDFQVERFMDENPHTRICDFCKCDIWNRCYHCNLCSNDDGYDICQACVAEGRGCSHKDNLVLMEHIPLKVIKEKIEEAKDAYQKVLKIIKRKKGKKKIEEWKSRTFSQVSPATLAHQLVQFYRKENTQDTCHQCEKVQPYTQAITIPCKSKGTGCGKKYCSRCLWNRYAIKLIDCLRQPQWSCPSCENKCNCNPCLELRSISPSSFSCENVLSEALEAFYPFQSLSAPNVPCVSDFKPVVHSLALKKRKFAYTPSSAPTTPTAPKSPPNLAKMTERQQIKFLTQSTPSFTEPSTPPKIIQRSASASNIPDELPRTPIKLEQPVIPVKKETPQQPNGHALYSNNNNDTPTSQKQSPWNTEHSPVKSAPPTLSNSSSSSSQDVWKANSSSSSNNNNGHETPSKYSGWDNPNPSSKFDTPKEGPDHQTTILVRNLHYSTTTQDLQELFQDCGAVDNVTIPVDKSSGKLKGYGFVKFRNRESAELAMKKHNYASLRDRAIEIEWSVDKVSQLRGDARLVCYKCGGNGHMAKLCPLNNSTAHQNTWAHRPPRFAKDMMDTSSDNHNEPLPEKDRDWGWGRDSSSSSREPSTRDSVSSSRDSSSSSSSYYRSDRSDDRERDRYEREKDTSRRDYNPSYESSSWDSKEPYSVDRDSQLSGSTKIHRGYICFKCGKEGHVALDCKQRSDTGPGFRGVVCFKCGQGGHLANKCDKKVRGCFICGKDGHIAVECTSDRALMPSDPQLQTNETYSYSNGSTRDSAWDTSPNKQRKLTSSSSPSKENPWDDRDKDRERIRERKSGWDDRPPTRDPRDPRYTSDNNTSSYYSSSSRRDDLPPSSSTSSRREDDRNPRDPRYQQQSYQDDSYTSSTSSSSSSRYPSSSSSAPKNGYPPANGNNTTITTTSPPGGVAPYVSQGGTFSGMGGMNMSTMNMNPLGMNLTMPLLNTGVNTANPNVSANLLSLFASGQIPMNPLNASSLQSLTQTITNLGNPAPSNLTSSSENKNDEGAKKYWKHYATNIVVARLSKFYNTGSFASKDDFKQLSKKVTTFLVTKFDGRYSTDKDTEAKIKKYVENYFDQYVMELQRGTQASWLASD